ncbi:MAG: FHA domain-containing protein [Deltaproteobacteria bacterium]|nr:MAG: FHA domain-containing protein [Deltaproteobacteria bacterium]
MPPLHRQDACPTELANNPGEQPGRTTRANNPGEQRTRGIDRTRPDPERTTTPTDMYTLVHYHDGARAQYTLRPGTPLIVGRHPECEVVLADASVSRQHARIEIDADGQPWVEDLGSFNGTYIADERIDRARLESGTDLRCGEIQLFFVEEGDERALPGPASQERLDSRRMGTMPSGPMLAVDIDADAGASIPEQLETALLLATELGACQQRLLRHFQELAAQHDRIATELEALFSIEQAYHRRLLRLVHRAHAGPGPSAQVRPNPHQTTGPIPAESGAAGPPTTIDPGAFPSPAED